MEEVLHTVWHLAQAFLPAGDHPHGQAGKQQEVQRGGQHRPQGEREKLPGDFSVVADSITVTDQPVVDVHCGYIVSNSALWLCLRLRPRCGDYQLMLDTWNESIFSNIKNRLQDSAMKLVHAERLGEAFDSQLVIGVRESYGETRVALLFQYIIDYFVGNTF